MRDAIDGDAAGLAVRIEGGELHFSHTAVAFLVEKTGSEYISRSSGNVL
jgi:hypothetical protein